MTLNELRSPFPEKDIEWRVQSSRNGKARVLAYVDARAIMDRLDEVQGPQFWQDEYLHLNDGVMCKIKCAFAKEDGNHVWITKEDGSPETKIEAFKGGISKAFVRCAVKWGIGRYLYDLQETEVELVQGYDTPRNSIKDGNTWTHWEKPYLPFWAIPLQDVNIELGLVIKKLEKLIEELPEDSDGLNRCIELMDKIPLENYQELQTLEVACHSIQELAKFFKLDFITKIKWKQRVKGIL